MTASLLLSNDFYVHPVCSFARTSAGSWSLRAAWHSLTDPADRLTPHPAHRTICPRPGGDVPPPAGCFRPVLSESSRVALPCPSGSVPLVTVHSDHGDHGCLERRGRGSRELSPACTCGPSADPGPGPWPLFTVTSVVRIAAT